MSIRDDHSVRLRLEAREETLSQHAVRSSASRGRAVQEEPSPLRTEFQRDRDRILHTNAFRRLKHKTQVFLAPLDDHYVTRLTHTLEVAQIARTISRALNLNEDLTEAIALGHDLGHSPFGHVGEEALDHLAPGGFRHNVQSLRVVDILEKDGQGLNLTWEVRQGILHHSKPRGDFLGGPEDHDLPLEAQVCRLADAVAYVNHDIGDALRAGWIQEQDLPQEVRRVLGTRHSQRIDTLVVDTVEASWACAATDGPAARRPVITMGRRVRGALNTLREFLFQRVYIPASQTPQARVAREIVTLLYAYFSTHPEAVPAEYWLRGEPAERVAVDYIAGMTDLYALRTAERLRPGVAESAFSFIGV
ncbi:MAG: deoxyguanosinetriphosphate triphosphohydrolase [Chloroflexi bacterium]|nr:deoxyguanosinetriphosphate triphosphohydrolase [Chloroflexota bacterium]